MKIRKLLTTAHSIKEIVDFGDQQVFEDDNAYIHACVLREPTPPNAAFCYPP